MATQFIDAGAIDELFITSANTLGNRQAQTFYEGSRLLATRTVAFKLLEPRDNEKDTIGPILRRVRLDP